MSDSKSSATARAFPIASARRGLTVGGIGLVALNLLQTMVLGASHALVLPALVWGAAAACFLGAFVSYMIEPAEKSDAPAASPSTPASATAPSPDAPAAPADVPAASEAAPESAPADDAPKRKLMQRGNPLRWTRGGVTTLVGALLTLLLMAKSTQWRWGVPLGAVLVMVTSWGVMDLMGTFDDPDDQLERSTTLADLAGPIGGVVATVVLFCLCLGGAQAGVMLPQWVWGLVVTLSFLATVVAVFALGRKLGPWALDEAGEERPLFRRHGFWVVALSGVLLFPAMGLYALWDPWETHYGEVTREMLARDDWISLWWAQDGWFWSKPVCDMWMQAVSMATLGVHYQPDKMLIGDGTRPLMHPEWAVRAPVVLLTIVAAYFLYRGCAKTFGRRPAMLGAIVLATMPDWYFIAHQTMTDMPFVGAMTASMGLVMAGLRSPEDEQARAYEVKVGGSRIRLTSWHLVFGAILICTIPQILYLLSRNFEFMWRPGAHGFRPHWDEFRSGSGGGNCGLPGNEECHDTWPASVPHSTGNTPEGVGLIVWRAVASAEPALQGLAWAAGLGVLLYMSWGERRVRRLCYLAAWFFAAVSTLAKGPAGFGLPMLVTLTYLCASRPGEDLLTRLLRIIRELTQFEIVGGLLVILVVSMPWYVAMYVRHGSPFTDRLIFHDMFNRAFHHVHDTNEGDDTSFRFYVWQLGYALFPWTGMAPLALLWWLRRGTTPRENDRADSSVFLCMWFLFAFCLFSFMGTKFHHYIFPAVPPIAMLIGVVLDDLLGEGSPVRPRTLPAYLAALTGGVGLAVYGLARVFPGSILGTKPGGHLADASPAVGVSIMMLGLLVVVGSSWALRAASPALAADEDALRESSGAEAPSTATSDEAASEERAAHASRMLAAGVVSGALLLGLVVRDLAIKPEGADQPGAIRLLQLFTYNYRRAWPDSLDFSAALAAFGVIVMVLSFGVAIRALRRYSVVAMCVAGAVWAVWGLDVYMEKTGQHWGQHEVIEAYYADRASPAEELVAYQMNWKGENFYTGNDIPAFVSTGSTFTTWLKKKREEGVKVMYFITEAGRVGGLKGEVAGKSYREVTDKELCNKFTLVRAEL